MDKKWILLLLAYFLTACPVEKAAMPVVVKPVIVSFTATPASLPASGGNTTLAWVVTGATSLSVDQGVGGVTSQNSKSVQVLSAKTFTLTASNSNGSSTATAAVTLEIVTDQIPPLIVSISPDDGATGVTATTPIMITFSEPMDQTATQTAYQSTSLPASGVSFGWDATGTSLTITPNTPLEYAKGTTLGTPRKTYVFTLTAAAKDKAGNWLVPVTSGFTTLLEITASLPSQYELDGIVTSNSLVYPSAIIVGDNDAKLGYRGFLTFDLTAVPSSLLASNLTKATIKLYKTRIFGDPYTYLVIPCNGVNQCDQYGTVGLDHVDYGISLENTDFATPSLGNLGVIDSLDIPIRSFTQADVLSAVRDDLKKRQNRSQYRLSFPVLTDGGAVTDAVVFGNGLSAVLEQRPALMLEYKIP